MAGLFTRRAHMGSGGPTDPLIGSVVLLCGFEGADASTSFVDESPSGHALTANGNAQIDTAVALYGASSLLLDGNGDYVSAADSADFEFGAGQFTIETSVQFNAAPVTVYFLAHYNNATLGWRFYYTASQLRFIFLDTGAASRSTTVAWAPSNGVRYRIAVDRDGAGDVRIYVDGVMLVKVNLPQTFSDANVVLSIGSFAIVPTACVNGWMDEVRITKGAARYASDGGYTPSSVAFPRT